MEHLNKQKSKNASDFDKRREKDFQNMEDETYSHKKIRAQDSDGTIKQIKTFSKTMLASDNDIKQEFIEESKDTSNLMAQESFQTIVQNLVQTFETPTLISGDSNISIKKEEEESKANSAQNKINICFQISGSNNIFTHESVLPANNTLLKDSMKQIYDDKDYSGYETKFLRQIPNSNMIINSVILKEDRAKGYANQQLFEPSYSTQISLHEYSDDEQKKLQTLSSQQVLCTSAKFSVCDQRNLVAGLSDQGRDYYKYFSYDSKKIEFKKRALWNHKVALFPVYDVDFANYGTRILTIDEQCNININNVETDDTILRYNGIIDNITGRTIYLSECNLQKKCRWLKDGSDKIVWNYCSYWAIPFLDTNQEQISDLFFCPKDDKIYTFDISKDGKIAFSMKNQTLRLFDFRSFKITLKIGDEFLKNCDTGFLDGIQWNLNNSNQILRYESKKIQIFDIRMFNNCLEFITKDHVRTVSFL